MVSFTTMLCGDVWTTVCDVFSSISACVFRMYNKRKEIVEQDESFGAVFHLALKVCILMF